MDAEPRNVDEWMQDALNNWAEQGALPSDKSAQLRAQIVRLAQRERRNRWIRKLYGLAAAIITWIWMLFASCPVAAAACRETFHPAADLAFLNVACFLLILVGIYIGQSLPLFLNMSISRWIYE